MKPTTRDIHNVLLELGQKLGFQTTSEVSNSILALRLDDTYRPRVDIMWSLPLAPSQSKALGEVFGEDASALVHLPIVGIEVEGTTPTTKTLASDVANIAALGTRLGLLVASEVGEKNICGRAARGDLPIERELVCE